MISFNHIGNLGRIANQMFQYASLKGIAKNRGYEFCIPPEQVFGQKDPLVKEDVIQALVGLGYKKRQSSKIVNDLADKEEYTDAETLLRDILSGKR